MSSAPTARWATRPPPHRDVRHLLSPHLGGVLDTKCYFHPRHQRPHMGRNLLSMLLRAPLTANEVRALRGMIAALARPKRDYKGSVLEHAPGVGSV